MRICMVGTRGHTNYIFEGMEQFPDAHLSGLCNGGTGEGLGWVLDICEERGDHPKVYDSYRNMLDVEEPEVLAVCGPFEKHAAICIEAFQRGIHVFAEKPVAATMEDLEKMETAFRAAKVHLGAMMNLRYAPAFYTAWKLVRQGAIGNVRLVYAQKSYKLGVRPLFYYKRETSTGLIPWVGSHAVDLIRYYTECDFRSVHAYHSARHNESHGDLEVSAACTFQLESEIIGIVSLDYFRPDNAPTHGDDRARIVGTSGVIEVWHGDVLLINDETNGEKLIPPACERHVFADFLGQVCGKGRSLLSPAEIFEVTRACLLARDSADRGGELIAVP